MPPLPLPRLAGWLWDFWRHCNERDYRAGVAALASLNQRTMALYDALEADGVEFEMHRSGLLLVFRSGLAMQQALEDFKPLQQYGYQLPQPLVGDKLRELEPTLSNEVVAGFWVEKERDLRPEMLTTGLVKRLAEMGVEVRTGIEIIGGIRHGSGLKAILSSQGLVEGDQFLIAAGAWSGVLARKLGFYVPIQAGKGYSITIESPELQLRRPLYLGEAKVGCTPFTGALRVAGTMELSDMRAGMQMDRVGAICRAVGRYLKKCPIGKSQSPWMGMRPITPDGLPVIGQIPSHDNLYIASGHAMLGVTLAPATSMAISDLLCGGQTSLDLRAFDPARFSS
ncbi:MAG: FAD-binding oxidoreductase [Acidobacteria bacterium]|nr:FAD-binding oxidoreductase [Acidobacteriota bacterium]